MQVSHRERSGPEPTSPQQAHPQRRAGLPCVRRMRRAAPPITHTPSCRCFSPCQKASRCCLACCGASCSRRGPLRPGIMPEEHASILRCPADPVQRMNASCAHAGPHRRSNLAGKAAQPCAPLLAVPGVAALHLPGVQCGRHALAVEGCRGWRLAAAHPRAAEAGRNRRVSPSRGGCPHSQLPTGSQAASLTALCCVPAPMESMWGAETSIRMCRSLGRQQ